MKATGLVLDETLQLNPTLITRPASDSVPAFPTRTGHASSTESYSTVVEQAILTHDKPLLQEILIECDPKLISNTVTEVNVGKLAGLLGLLEEFLYADCKNTVQYCAWVKEIMVRHLGVVLSNFNNKSTLERISRFLNKKTSQRTQLLELKNKVNLKQESPPQKQFVPKFSYVETKGKEGEGEVQEDRIRMGEGDFQFDDDAMFDEFDA